jgi:uncharacterized membrane protein YvbJ
MTSGKKKQVTCPNCGKETPVGPAKHGQMVHCEHCGKTIMLRGETRGKRAPRSVTAESFNAEPEPKEDIKGDSKEDVIEGKVVSKEPTGPLIFCPKCGTKNAENSYRCLQCGHVLPHESRVGPTPTYTNASVPNYLVQAILVTVFCCLPLGIPAIVFASQVNSKLAAGDATGAVESSEKAKQFCWIAFILGAVLQGAWFIMFFLQPFAGGTCG